MGSVSFQQISLFQALSPKEKYSLETEMPRQFWSYPWMKIGKACECIAKAFLYAGLFWGALWKAREWGMWSAIIGY